MSYIPLDCKSAEMQDVLHPLSCVRGDCGRRAHVEDVLLNLDLRLGATPWLDSAGSARCPGI